MVVHDTVYVEQGKAELNDDAKLALHNLAKVLMRNPELRLSI